MKNGFRVFDCNRHVIEPVDLWERQVEGPAAGRASVAVDASRSRVSVLGRPASRRSLDFLSLDVYRACFADAIAADFSSAATLRDMDREGVDAALLFPTAGMYTTWADHVDGEASAALCRAYNRWLKEYCAAAPERLKGVALLPLQSIDRAVAELHQSVGEGHVAFVMRPNPLVGRYLHDPAYDRLYSEAQSLGVPVIVKEMMGSVLPTIGMDRFPGLLYQRKAVVDSFELMLAFLSFFGANITERFPELKVGFVGAGAGWLPYWLERHEEHWGATPFGNDCPSTLPADWLFRRQGFVAADPWETTAAAVAAVVGEGCLVWGSYYPLPEAVPHFPSGAAAFVEDARLPEETKRRLLWTNAARLFGLT